MLGGTPSHMGPFLKAQVWEWSLKEIEGLEAVPPDLPWFFLPDECISQGLPWLCWQGLMLWRAQTWNTETHTFGS